MQTYFDFAPTAGVTLQVFGLVSPCMAVGVSQTVLETLHFFQKSRAIGITLLHAFESNMSNRLIKAKCVACINVCITLCASLACASALCARSYVVGRMHAKKGGARDPWIFVTVATYHSLHKSILGAKVGVP